MTLVQLQDKLGEQIELITDTKTPFSERKRLGEIAQTVSSLAKQMINNADIVLRTEKLVGEGKMKNGQIVQMISGTAHSRPKDQE